MKGCDFLKRMILGADIPDVSLGEGRLGDSTIQPRLPEFHQAISVTKMQRPEQRRLEDAEHHGACRRRSFFPFAFPFRFYDRSYLRLYRSARETEFKSLRRHGAAEGATRGIRRLGRGAISGLASGVALKRCGLYAGHSKIWIEATSQYRER